MNKKTYIFSVLLFIASINTVISQTFSNVAQSLSVTTNLNSFDNYGASVSFYDFNQDGLDDLTFAAENDSILFYKNNGGTFQHIGSYVFGNGNVKQVSWIDIDNDHDLDLFMSIFNGTPRLLINDGNFNFTDNSTFAGLPSSNTENYGTSFADFNNDGYLDIYIANYVYGYASTDHDRLNRLFKNNGDGTFTNVTLSAGVGDSIKTTFQGLWFDWNMDGWIDLYVINDRYPFENTLYRNNGDETFTDVTNGSGLEFPGGNPMTITIDDFNNDGYPDIYTTNVGNGNPTQLFVNNGNGTFSEQSQALGTQLDNYSWGALWIDYDNDTWQDLYVATGHPSTFFSQTKSAFFVNQTGQYFVQNDNMFLDDLMAPSFSVAKGDIDNDGYYDIVSYNDDGDDPFLWQNSGTSNNYIKISLEGTTANYNAIGAHIEVFANGSKYSKFVYSVENYISQNSQHLIFGLGQASIVDSVKIKYPGGHLDRYYDVQVNTHHFFKEGETTATQINAPANNLFCTNVNAELFVNSQDSVVWNTGDIGDTLFTNTPGSYYAFVITPTYSYYTDTVTIDFTSMPTIIEDVENVTCNGFSNGSIDLFINSQLNSAEYSIDWSNGESGTQLIDLQEGSYQYFYEDIYGCLDTGNIQVEAPYPLEIYANLTHETNGNDGSIDVFVNGGTPPYDYIFNGAQVLPPYSGLSAGSYGFNVVDINGCNRDTIFLVESLLSNATLNIESLNISVSPNPIISDLVNIFTNKDLENILVIIFDQTGKKIIQKEFHSWNAGKQIIELPNETPKGIYQLYVRSSEHSEVFKIKK